VQRHAVFTGEPSVQVAISLTLPRQSELFQMIPVHWRQQCLQVPGNRSRRVGVALRRMRSMFPTATAFETESESERCMFGHAVQEISGFAKNGLHRSSREQLRKGRAAGPVADSLQGIGDEDGPDIVGARAPATVLHARGGSICGIKSSSRVASGMRLGP